MTLLETVVRRDLSLFDFLNTLFNTSRFVRQESFLSFLTVRELLGRSFKIKELFLLCSLYYDSEFY